MKWSDSKFNVGDFGIIKGHTTVHKITGLDITLCLGNNSQDHRVHIDGGWVDEDDVKKVKVEYIE